MVEPLTPLLVVALASGPWLLIATRRLGHLLGVPVVAIAAVLVVFGAMILGRWSGLDIRLPVLIAAIVGFAGGVVLLLRTPGAIRRPSRYALALWLPATTGGIAWLVTLLVAQVVPGAARLSWAMNGDANNNLFYASRIIAARGVALGTGESPVPLVQALLALGVVGGRPDSIVGGLIQHDVAALGWVWAVLLGTVGMAAGVTAASAVDPARTGTVVAVGALASCLPLTWFVAGLPIEYGYLNVHLAIPLVLAGWLIYRGSPGHLVTALVALACITTLLLATWSPLALFSVALAAVIVLRDRMPLRALTVRTGWPLIAALAPPLAWLLVASGPAIREVGFAFELPGHGLPLVLIPMLACLAVVASAVLAPPDILPPGWRSGALAMAAAAVVGTGVLTFLARDSGAITAYYPAKFVWLTTVVLGAIAIGVLVAFAQRRAVGRWLLPATAAAVLVPLIAATIGPLPPTPGFALHQPLDRILSGSVWHDGDRTVRTIVANSDPGDPGILWASGEPDEAYANFWILQEIGGDIGGDTLLRVVAFTGFRHFRSTGENLTQPVEKLCLTVDRLDRPVRIITRDSGLPDEVAAACPMTLDRMTFQTPD